MVTPQQLLLGDPFVCTNAVVVVMVVVVVMEVVVGVVVVVVVVAAVGKTVSFFVTDGWYNRGAVPFFGYKESD